MVPVPPEAEALIEPEPSLQRGCVAVAVKVIGGGTAIFTGVLAVHPLASLAVTT